MTTAQLGFTGFREIYGIDNPYLAEAVSIKQNSSLPVFSFENV